MRWTSLRHSSGQYSASARQALGLAAERRATRASDAARTGARAGGYQARPRTKALGGVAPGRLHPTTSEGQHRKGAPPCFDRWRSAHAALAGTQLGAVASRIGQAGKGLPGQQARPDCSRWAGRGQKAWPRIRRRGMPRGGRRWHLALLKAPRPLARPIFYGTFGIIGPRPQACHGSQSRRPQALLSASFETSQEKRAIRNNNRVLFGGFRISGGKHQSAV